MMNMIFITMVMNLTRSVSQIQVENLLCAQPAKRIRATYHAQLVMRQIGSRQRTAQKGINANHALMLIW